LVNDVGQVSEGLDFFQRMSIQHDWILACGFYLEELGLISVNIEANLRLNSCHCISLLLHLLFIMEEKNKVISKVHVIELNPRGPLESVSWLSSGFLHNSINGKKKQEVCQKASFSNSCFHMEVIGELPSMYDSTSHSIIILPN